MTVVRLMNIGRGAVLSLCDRTGNLVRPWADAGFECLCVDIAHPAGEERRDGITWIGADVRTWLPPPRRYAIVFAAPPCSNLAVSGTRWFKEKGVGGLTEALEMGDQKIGEILFASVRQPDKPWPPEPVCEVIEIARSRALERGLETGVYNRRGVTPYACHSTGATRSVASPSSYRRDAEALRFDWPRTAACLDRIAETYEHDARSEDRGAEQRDWL